MAINIKDIINRKYSETLKALISFEYVIKDLEGPHGEPQELRVWFERVKPEDYGLDENKPAYEIYTIVNDVVYRKVFGMPKSGMSLEMVVASGLVLLGTIFKEEAAQKEMLSYTIADIVKDM